MGELEAERSISPSAPSRPSPSRWSPSSKINLPGPLQKLVGDSFAYDARVVRREHCSHATAAQCASDGDNVIAAVRPEFCDGDADGAVKSFPRPSRKTMAVCHRHDLGRFATSSFPNKERGKVTGSGHIQAPSRFLREMGLIPQAI